MTGRLTETAVDYAIVPCILAVAAAVTAVAITLAAGWGWDTFWMDFAVLWLFAGLNVASLPLLLLTDWMQVAHWVWYVIGTYWVLAGIYTAIVVRRAGTGKG